MGRPHLHGLTVSYFAKDVVEYRVSNPSFLKQNNWLSIHSFVHPGLLFVLVRLTFNYYSTQAFTYAYVTGVITALYCYALCNQVLHESIIVIPRYGVQLEVHRGFAITFLPRLTLSKQRHFVPVTSICDIVINEGLYRWNVRYYLCIIKDDGEISLDVVFKNILPQFPVLKYVYNGVHDTLWGKV